MAAWCSTSDLGCFTCVTADCTALAAGLQHQLALVAMQHVVWLSTLHCLPQYWPVCKTVWYTVVYTMCTVVLAGSATSDACREVQAAVIYQAILGEQRCRGSRGYNELQTTASQGGSWLQVKLPYDVQRTLTRLIAIICIASSTIE